MDLGETSSPSEERDDHASFDLGLAGGRSIHGCQWVELKSCKGTYCSSSPKRRILGLSWVVMMPVNCVYVVLRFKLAAC